MTLDLAPGTDVPAFLRDRRRSRARSAEGATILGEILPARLAAALAPRLGLGGTLANLPDRALDAAAARHRGLARHPDRHRRLRQGRGHRRRHRHRGLSSKTMAARAVPGLFAIGEAVDVTGWLGGYNFQWAWASGVAAGGAL